MPSGRLFAAGYRSTHSVGGKVSNDVKSSSFPTERPQDTDRSAQAMSRLVDVIC
jgi:hypothetical protein